GCRKTPQKTDATEQRGMCAGGKKPTARSIKQDFETFKKVSKSAQRGEKTFSTRWGSISDRPAPRKNAAQTGRHFLRLGMNHVDALLEGVGVDGAHGIGHGVPLDVDEIGGGKGIDAKGGGGVAGGVKEHREGEA